MDITSGFYILYLFIYSGGVPICDSRGVQHLPPGVHGLHLYGIVFSLYLGRAFTYCLLYTPVYVVYTS